MNKIEIEVVCVYSTIEKWGKMYHLRMNRLEKKILYVYITIEESWSMRIKIPSVYITAGFTLAPWSPRSPRSRKIVELHDFVFLPRFRTLPYASNKFCHDLWRFITNPTRLWSRSTTNFSTIRQAFSRSSRWTLAFSHVLLRSLETCHVCYVLLRSATIMETIQRGSPRLSHDWHIKRT